MAGNQQFKKISRNAKKPFSLPALASAWWLKKVPVGYENETGFHFGNDEAAPAPPNGR